MSRVILEPETVHKPTTVYSHVIAVGETIYTAGQAPHDITGRVVPPTDPEGQIRQVFQNLGAVLESVAVGFGDIARLTVFLRRREDLPTVWKVAPDYLGAHLPAVTLTFVDGLAGADYLIEMDAIAVKGMNGS